MKPLFPLFILLFSAKFLFCQTDSVVQKTQTCLVSETFKQQFPKELYKEYYPFINYHLNFIQSPSKDILHSFFNLPGNKNKKVRILHIGDSHIHSDIFTGYVRKRLQALFGSGGRGLLFPYCTASTHATKDYRTICTGTWTAAKATDRVLLYDLGVTGVTARTEDPNATASIIIRPAEYTMKRTTTIITMLYMPHNQSFDPIIRSGGNTWKIISRDDENGLIKGELEWNSDTLVISFEQNDSTQTFFEIYGLIAEYKAPGGIVYNSCGINGAAMYHLTNQKLIENHLRIINPDLLVLDLGTNDIYRGTFDESVLYRLISGVIQRVKASIPSATILLMPPQDMYYRKKHVVNTEKYSALLKKIAKEQECLFYDYFAVSGGNYSMLEWEKHLLGRKDRLHLTGTGYELKGKLFVTAFLDAILRLKISEEGPEENFTAYDSSCVALLFDDAKMYGGIPVVAEKPIPTQTTTTTTRPPAGGSTTHTVKSGENLGLIAQKYGVTVSQIQQWNNIKGTTIYAGQKLIIYGKTSQTSTNNTSAISKETPSTQSSSTGSTKTTHTVQSGESLYSIAKKHGVTVENIKKWNKLDSDKIFPGQKLTLYK
jgi:LysM repeat protein/lysophospholipase L1-like esterase